jgi:hypothetical protein
VNATPAAPISLFERIVALIAASPGGGELGEFTEEIRRLSDERGLTPEAAALLVAQRRGVATPALADEVLAHVQRSRGATSESRRSETETSPG